MPTTRLAAAFALIVPCLLAGAPAWSAEAPAARAATADTTKISIPAGIHRQTSVEGITEYRLDNGLKVLLIPDPSADIITVNATYLVGSRHEGYGESGMAHLLEHLLFRGTPSRPNIKDELNKRGARFNGSTSNDRTNYYETDRKSTRLNSSHTDISRMPSSA